VHAQGSSALAKESPELLVGWRVSVYWPDEAEGSDGWYTGQVTEYAAPGAAGAESDSSGKHKVVYDDGSSEFLDLVTEQYRLTYKVGAPQLRPPPGLAARPDPPRDASSFRATPFALLCSPTTEHALPSVRV